MDTLKNRELNNDLDTLLRNVKQTHYEAVRASRGSSSQHAEWTLRAAESALRTAERVHSAHYDLDLRDIMDREEEMLEEEESRLQDQIDYVNRVHQEIFPNH